MNKLILCLTLLPILAYAAGVDRPEVQEMSDAHIKNKFLSVVQDVHVEKTIGASAEFNDCRKMNAFVANEQPDQKNKKLKEATECFTKRMGTDPVTLQKLSESLKLETYGLVKSKNVSEITGYLSNKMIKALTGRDPDEKDPKKILEQMKWEKQKIVDQKVFIDLYTNQLMKNALFEISRFCFENLRVKGSTESVFDKHWVVGSFKYTADKRPDITKLSDNGDPSFFTLPATIDMSKKEEVSRAMVSSLSSGTSIDPTLYKEYFGYCQSAMPLLCEEFKKNTASQKKDVSIDASKFEKAKDMNDGANACLTLDRIRSIRTAMANTKKVADQFETMNEGKDAYALQMITQPQIYQRGHGQGEESLDSLTSVSSSDILGEVKKDKLDQLQKDCAFGEGGSECKDFLVTGDGLEKSIQNVETEMNLKREVEIARVKLLKTKPTELKEYLKENGLFDLLNELETNPNIDIEAKIGQIYDARRLALIEGLKVKVGKRQISEEQGKNLTDATKDLMRSENIKDSREEKARLAQVVMFNNIITSQLDLTDSASGKSVGRNVTGWNKELSGLTGEKGGFKADDALFRGLQDIAKKEGNTRTDTSVVGGEIIDGILGKKKEKKTP